MYAFSRSPPGQGVMPTNLRPAIAPRMEPSYTHIPASIKSGGAYTSLKSQLSTVPLPDNCVMIPVFQDGSLPFQYTHKHSSPLRQALHTQIANRHIQRARKSFYCVFFYFLLSVGGFFQSSAQPHESAARPPQRAAGHIKGTRPPC